MAQEIVLGSPVHCTDGKAGSIDRIVLDPTTMHLDYIVVHRGFFGGHDHCVPAGNIREASADVVTLTLGTDELKAMPEFEFRVPGTSIPQRSVPERCAVLGKGTPIQDEAGSLLGHFHGVGLGAGRAVERIYLDDRTDIPVARVGGCDDDALTVRLAEQAVGG